MEVLKQCQKWFEQNEIQKVIDALEAIPTEERTPELDCELAKAYITIAEVGERKPFEKALHLLALHEEDLPCITLNRHSMPVPATRTPRDISMTAAAV